MKRRPQQVGEKKNTIVVGFVILATLGAGGDTLTWTGAEGGAWNTTSRSWKRTDTGVPAVYAEGDDVTFTDVGTDVTNVVFASDHVPGHVVYDIADYFSLNFRNGNYRKGVKSITKRGAGTMYFGSTDSNAGRYNDSTAPVIVEAGRLDFDGPNYSASFGRAYDITIKSGGELRVLARNCIGKLDKRFEAYASVTVEEGGAFTLCAPGWHAGNSVSNLHLKGGELRLKGVGASPHLGILRVLDTVSISGTKPYEIASTTGYGDQYWLLGWGTSPTRFDVADVTGDDSPDLTMKMSFTRGDMANDLVLDPEIRRGFTKTGAGRMKIAQDEIRDKKFGANGVVRVEEGTLEYAQQNLIFSDHPVDHYVGTNATLHFSSRNVFSYRTVPTNGVRGMITVDHGSFIIDDPVEHFGHNYVGRELVLDHAMFENRMNGYGAATNELGLMTLGELVWFKAGGPYVLAPATAGLYRQRVHLQGGTPTELRVEKLSDESEEAFDYDAMLGYQLVDDLNRYTQQIVPGGFMKTGAGTLLITNTASTFTGDVELREGLTVLDSQTQNFSDCGNGHRSFLGDFSVVGRKIVVNTNATLQVNLRNPFVAYQPAIKPDKGNNDAEAEFILRGRLVFKHGTINFGDLTLDGGTLDYSETVAAQIGLVSAYGPITVRGVLKVTGEKAQTLPSVPKTGTVRLPLYPLYATSFHVDDVTTNALPDLTIDLALAQPPEAIRTNYVYGFTKTGLGTLCLTANHPVVAKEFAYDGEARVQEGTLQVDGDVSTSGDTLVAAGAALSGTGVVANVVFADGAGLRQSTGRAKGLTVKGDVSFGEGLTLAVDNLANVAVESIRVPFLEVQGNVTGAENLKDCRIVLDGEEQKRGRWSVLFSHKTLTVTSLVGTMIILR